nr:hypothetical protein Itr_chr08CG07080 [Ipomoea trifida]GMD22033.1 hypothetical protein Iba_chr08aCG6950 [Ipomoea batatas]
MRTQTLQIPLKVNSSLQTHRATIDGMDVVHDLIKAANNNHAQKKLSNDEVNDFESEIILPSLATQIWSHVYIVMPAMTTNSTSREEELANLTKS